MKVKISRTLPGSPWVKDIKIKKFNDNSLIGEINFKLFVSKLYLTTQSLSNLCLGLLSPTMPKSRLHFPKLTWLFHNLLSNLKNEVITKADLIRSTFKVKNKKRGS